MNREEAELLAPQFVAANRKVEVNSRKEDYIIVVSFNYLLTLDMLNEIFGDVDYDVYVDTDKKINALDIQCNFTKVNIV